MRHFACILLVVLLCVSVAVAWPGMKAVRGQRNPHDKKGVRANVPIGPDCTVGAHTTARGPCPNTPQPPSPPTDVAKFGQPMIHHFADNFVMQWKMYMVVGAENVPPYKPGGPGPGVLYNLTEGWTYYALDKKTGLRSMREKYVTYCIPVFGDPSSPMGRENKYSCDFINVGKTNTSFVVLHEDRPKGSPRCCIIGKPFHPPPPTFAEKMPLLWRDDKAGDVVDWTGVVDSGAGLFAWGFHATKEKIGVPHSFYFTGVPWIANWLYQPFYNFVQREPPEDAFDLPQECFAEDVVPCPGWEPQ